MVVSPWLVRVLFKNLLWKIKTKEKVIYLTFDDGPTPEITDWVLNELDKFEATATFFCIGKNVVENPEIFKRILKRGHNIGNHTHNHLNGWKTDADIYMQNVDMAQRAIEKNADFPISTKWFRPPYGKISIKQSRLLRENDFVPVMWHIVAYDWDTTINAKKCANNIIKNALPGSIIVLHDSVKAFNSLKEALPEVLNHFHKEGYTFKALS